MNTTLNTRAALISRITRRAAAITASTLVTFTGLQLITNCAMPRQPAAEAVTMTAAATTSATQAR